MKYAAKKIGLMLLTMVIVSFLAFLAFQVIPGDPAVKLLGTEATPERIAALRKPLQKELAKVEKELAQKNEELRKLSDRLADGDFYTSTDPDEVARVLREHGELKPVVEELEMRWLELSEEIEAVC